MKENLTELVFILDRSGSMSSLRKDAIGAFNTFVEDQKRLPGEANLTLVLFNHDYTELFASKPIKGVSPITEKDYVPAGMTAYLDAIGRTIDTVGERIAALSPNERPDKVAIAVMTDGYENASKDYTRARVRGMVEHQQSKYSWEFFFLGANMDAVAESNALGIQTLNTMCFAATSRGTRKAMNSYSTTIGSYRSTGDTDLNQYDQEDA
jgi:hypothetical protein